MFSYCPCYRSSARRIGFRMAALALCFASGQYSDPQAHATALGTGPLWKHPFKKKKKHYIVLPSFCRHCYRKEFCWCITRYIAYTVYEGVSINNQPVPFPMGRDGHVFMLCFNICFIHGYKIAHVSSHSLIRYWMSNMASNAKGMLFIQSWVPCCNSVLVFKR